MLFYAYWCNSSNIMLPIFNRIAREFGNRIEFINVDVETPEGVDLSCQYVVRNPPVLIFEKDGKEIQRVKGLQTYDEVRNLIKKYV